MSFVELFMIAVGLSMDAFEVSVCKGLSTYPDCDRYKILIEYLIAEGGLLHG